MPGYHKPLTVKKYRQSAAYKLSQKKKAQSDPYNPDKLRLRGLKPNEPKKKFKLKRRLSY